MSHNTISVNAQTPSATGAITQALGDLSDVSTSGVNDGYALVYSSGSWSGAPNPVSNTAIFIAEGASQAYSGSGASGVSSGDIVEFYDGSVINSISGSTVTSSNSWVSSVTLPVGTYRVRAHIALTFSASDSVKYQIYQDNIARGGAGFVGQDDITMGNYASAFVTVSAGTDVIDVRLTSTATNINAINAQGTRHAEYAYLIIERVA